MKTFYRDTNNGITVVVSEDDYEGLRGDRDFPATFFTFARNERAAEEPWLTGGYVLMDLLLDGHMVLPGSIYVPFSNGDLHMKTSRQIRDYLRAYCTPIEQVIETFGPEARSQIVMI